MSTLIRRIATIQPEVRGAPPIATRYETLARVSRAIAAYSDPRELFGVFVDELREAVPFDFIGVSLRAQNSDTFQNYCVDMANRSALAPKETLTLDDTLTSWVYEGQEPLLRSTDEMEPRYGRLQPNLKRRNVRSICSIPLTTATEDWVSSLSAARSWIPTHLRKSHSCLK